MRKRRIFRFQQLENRQLLAGDVTVVVDGSGDLIITGDAESNLIEVTQELDGDITFTGVDGTTINGMAAETFDAAPLSGNATADMGAGDDEGTILDVDFAGDVSITGGVDADVLVMTGGSVDNLIVDLGPHTNSTTLTNVSVMFDVAVTGLSGTDDVTISGGSIGGNVDLELGGGVNNSVDITGGAAITGNVRVVTGIFDDSVTISTATVQGDVMLFLSGGVNTVTLTDATLQDVFSVRAAAGNDTLSITGGDIGFTADVTLGAGVNSVVTTDADMGRLVVSALAGADSVTVAGGHVSGKVELVLGDGLNVVDVDSAIVDLQLVIVGGVDADDVVVASTRVGSHLRVLAGDGANTVVVADGTQVISKTEILLGDGNDQVGVSGAMSGNLTIDGGEGTLEALVENTLLRGSLSVTGGGDADHVFVETGTSVSGGGAAIDTGAGADIVRVNGATIDGTASIDTDLGADVVVVQNSRIGRLSGALATSLLIEAGDDGDQIFAQQTLVHGDATINAGAGDDEVLLNSNLQVTDTLLVDGGLLDADEIDGDLFDLIVAGTKLALNFESLVTDLVAADFDFIGGLVADLRTDLGL